MIVKVGGDDTAIHIIGRMLYRREKMHIHIARHYHDASWMLASGTLDSHAALSQTIYIGNMFSLSFFFEEFFHIAKSCLICHSLDRTGLINIILAKENLRIFMCHRLIDTREVQVDIRHLVSIKTKENCKRNIMTILHHFGPANWAILIRQIIATAVGTICYKLTMLAVRTAPMRWQRIYLGNIRHGCYKG